MNIAEELKFPKVTTGTFVHQKQDKWTSSNWPKAAFDKYATINQALPH